MTSKPTTKTSFATITWETRKHPNCGDEEVGSISKDSKDTHGFAGRTQCFRLKKYRKGGRSYLVRDVPLQAQPCGNNYEPSLSTEPC